MVHDLLDAPTLATERLRLRLPGLEDLPAFTSMGADTGVMEFLNDGKPLSDYESWLRLAGVMGHWALLGYGLFAVEETATAAVIGRIGLLRPPTWPALELAWTLARPAWGKGYATEASAAAREWAKVTLAPDRLVSLIHPMNHRSIRVAEKLGARPAEQIDLFGKPAIVYEHPL
jgi:RimJ/RimL family protein N-acetyltransferase